MTNYVNKNALVKFIVGDPAIVIGLGLEDVGVKYTVVESIGNKTGAVIYLVFPDLESYNSKLVYNALANGNYVTIIIGDQYYRFSTFKQDKIMCKRIASKALDYIKVINTPDDDLDTDEDSDGAEFTIDVMDANYFDYIKSCPPDAVFELPNTDAGSADYIERRKKWDYTKEAQSAKSTAKFTVARILKGYEFAYEYADALGWSFTKPLIRRTRTVDEFNTMPTLNGEWNVFKTKSYVGADMYQTKDYYNPPKLDSEGNVIAYDRVPKPVYVTTETHDSEAIVKLTPRSHYKNMRTSEFNEVLEFGRYFLKLQAVCDAQGLQISDFFEPGYGICPNCGKVVRTEGEPENRFCWFCDKEIPGYTVTNAYWDDRNYEGDDEE